VSPAGPLVRAFGYAIALLLAIAGLVVKIRRIVLAGSERHRSAFYPE
jgi:hypothetical protein